MSGKQFCGGQEYISEGLHHCGLAEHRSHLVLMIIKQYLLATKPLTTENWFIT